jgi:hypothetical protein
MRLTGNIFDDVTTQARCNLEIYQMRIEEYKLTRIFFTKNHSFELTGNDFWKFLKNILLFRTFSNTSGSNPFS